MRSDASVRREQGRLRRILAAAPVHSEEWAKATYALLALAWVRSPERGDLSAADHLLKRGAAISPARSPRPRKKEPSNG